jgi:aryl-alcohol dehydrogenase-like predicted oxidoreductase
MTSDIERAEFGRTGHISSRVIFGSAGTGRADQEIADRLLPLLLSHAVNHIDTAASYGEAEFRLASWLRSHPGEFFLAHEDGRAYRHRGGPASSARSPGSVSITSISCSSTTSSRRTSGRWRTARAGGRGAPAGP